jgi:hypothetical protein
MVRRDDKVQTAEQRWCGTWFDCPEFHCRNSRLIPSQELLAVV